VPRFFVGDLTALGYDPEDGQLPATAISWKSNLDGDLGTGDRLSLRRLSAGEHTLTATASDSSGATGTGTIHLTVLETGAKAPRYQGADPDAERRLLAGAAVPEAFGGLLIAFGAVAALASAGAAWLLRRRIRASRRSGGPRPT
jgi:hypothetical protein